MAIRISGVSSAGQTREVVVTLLRRRSHYCRKNCRVSSRKDDPELSPQVVRGRHTEGLPAMHIGSLVGLTIKPIYRSRPQEHNSKIGT